MYYQSIISFFLFTLIIACSSPEEKAASDIDSNSIATTETTTEAPQKHQNENAFVAKVEEAHHREDFLSKKAIQFDIVLTFGGNERLNGTILTTTDSRRGVITHKNGHKVYYNENDVYYSPEMENPQRIRFGAYTWPYFFLYPYKLSDPGTNWKAYENSMLNDKEYFTQQLTFDAGTGDDPEDWYIAYADKETHLIDVAAYIVTAGGSTQAEAEKDPHAIQYKDYTMIDGIPIAQNWIFWEWRKEEGLTKELGAATLSNIKFVNVNENTFDAPESFSKT
ncbi:DUF6503 family protein [Aureispira sp. CCB-E]|uniref:DUF6503 family protein n=1 Tax=Aureispira sp. CCB-E TaxID=3051121 RepID=UPI0028686601|nr:DUF6503 family protein [Aureispira sp. CCB-E]WMX13836.1 DUF6503 family protein [Aureispira sp. CCB-E]